MKKNKERSNMGSGLAIAAIAVALLFAGSFIFIAEQSDDDQFDGTLGALVELTWSDIIEDPTMRTVDDGIFISGLSTSGKAKMTGDVSLEKITKDGGGDPIYIHTIGPGAFMGCNGLKSIELGPKVVNIGDRAFGGCNNLESIKATGNDLFAVIAGGLFELDSPLGDPIRLVAFPAAYFGSVNSFNFTTTVPTVEIIAGYAFENCTGITSIEIGAGVTEIGVGAFSGCTDITSIEMGAGVKKISDYTFENCTSITSIEIGAGVTEIGVGVFSGCTGITSIEIGPGVEKISDGAFKGCTNLASITVTGTYFKVLNGALFELDDYGDPVKLVSFPAKGTLADGKYTPGTPSFDLSVMPTVKFIAGYAFDGTNLGEFVVPVLGDQMHPEGSEHTISFGENALGSKFVFIVWKFDTPGFDMWAYKGADDKWKSAQTFIDPDPYAIAEAFEITPLWHKGYEVIYKLVDGTTVSTLKVIINDADITEEKPFKVGMGYNGLFDYMEGSKKWYAVGWTADVGDDLTKVWMKGEVFELTGNVTFTVASGADGWSTNPEGKEDDGGNTGPFGIGGPFMWLLLLLVIILLSILAAYLVSKRRRQD
jgi:hypothetical protein